MTTAIDTGRASHLRVARRLELITIAWAGTEAALGLLSAWRSHSVSLAAFGFDSLIEVASAVALLLRLRMDNPGRRNAAEHASLRFVAICLLLLAVYTAVEAVRHLFFQRNEAVSALGIFVTTTAVTLMPLLGRAKRRVGRQLASPAMIADSRQADFCALQSLIVLLGLLIAHWWPIKIADSVAALLLVPLIVRESVRAFQGKSCCGDGACD